LQSIKGVEDVSRVDVRVSGKRLDVNVCLLVKVNLDLEEAHRIALSAETEVKKAFPRARVIVNTEPVGADQESVWKLIKDIAEGTPGSRGVHNIHIQRISDKLNVDMHLEVSSRLTVKQAHDIADQVETAMKFANPSFSKVVVHIETASERVSREMAGIETELESYVLHIAKKFPEIKDVFDVEIRKAGDALHMVLRCHFDANLSIQKAHQISSQLEKEIRRAYPKITRIDVHEEPI
jgi:divalent metal cation (Fe/Co/Zn/Cd) transporter